MGFRFRFHFFFVDRTRLFRPGGPGGPRRGRVAGRHVSLTKKRLREAPRRFEKVAGALRQPVLGERPRFALQPPAVEDQELVASRNGDVRVRRERVADGADARGGVARDGHRHNGARDEHEHFFFFFSKKKERRSRSHLRVFTRVSPLLCGCIGEPAALRRRVALTPVSRGAGLAASRARSPRPPPRDAFSRRRKRLSPRLNLESDDAREEAPAPRPGTYLRRALALVRRARPKPGAPLRRGETPAVRRGAARDPRSGVEKLRNSSPRGRTSSS